MDMSTPQSVLLSKTDSRVLSVLAGTTKGLSGREVASLAGMSQGSVWRSLRRFVEHGLVTEEEAGGRTLLYRLNRDHLAAEAVITLTRLRALLAERLQASIASWEIAPIHASLFGSAARGDGDTVSDIDILVIRPKAIDEDDERWRPQINGLAESVRTWTGNHAGVSELSEANIPRLRRERPPVIQDVQEQSITLFGPDAADLFRRR